MYMLGKALYATHFVVAEIVKGLTGFVELIGGFVGTFVAEDTKRKSPYPLAATAAESESCFCCCWMSDHQD
jgi:uncharacterized membrane protein